MTRSILLHTDNKLHLDRFSVTEHSPNNGDNPKTTLLNHCHKLSIDLSMQPTDEWCLER